jgi:hypothetical protein
MLNWVPAWFYICISKLRSAPLSVKNFLTKIVGIKPIIETVAAVALVYFAYSTDRVYHRLADIAETQTKIMDAQNRPLFIVQIETRRATDNSNILGEKLIVSNSGAPVSYYTVNTGALFTLRSKAKSPPPVSGVITWKDGTFDCSKVFDHSALYYLTVYFKNDGRQQIKGIEPFSTAESSEFSKIKRAVDLANEMARARDKEAPKLYFNIIHLVEIRSVDRLGRKDVKQFLITRNGALDTREDAHVQELTEDEYKAINKAAAIFGANRGTSTIAIAAGSEGDQANLAEILLNEPLKYGNFDSGTSCIGVGPFLADEPPAAPVQSGK